MTTGISQNKLRSQQEKPKEFHTRYAVASFVSIHLSGHW